MKPPTFTQCFPHASFTYLCGYAVYSLHTLIYVLPYPYVQCICLQHLIIPYPYTNKLQIHTNISYSCYSYVVKSRRMRWAGHVARMGEGRGVHRVLVGKRRERDHWGDPDLDGRIILRWIFRKWERVEGTGCSWLRIGTGGGHL